MDIEELKKRVWRYVELETEAKVISVKFIESFRAFGRDDAVIQVVTTDKSMSEWWAVGGDTPMNIYEKEKFNSPDEVFSFHIGTMARLMEKIRTESKNPLEQIGYDVFISHASEDKDDFVRPLAKILKEYGFRVWYDEFELKVGDSLRESIDKGLVSSRYGIVVLSSKFLNKSWTKYELNSLVAKEIEGEKVILPIWHKVTKNQIIQYSPMLADKLALSSESMSIDEIAKKLSDTLTE